MAFQRNLVFPFWAIEFPEPGKFYLPLTIFFRSGRQKTATWFALVGLQSAPLSM